MSRPLLIAVVCFWLPCGTVDAQCVGGRCPLVPVAHPAVARIVNERPDGQYLGSGTLIDKDGRRGIVVTCAHLFRDGAGQIRVTFPDGDGFGAKLVAIDRQSDLAALEIGPPRASPVVVATEAPRPGEPLRSCGYGPDGRYRCNEGRARGYVQASGMSGRETLELSGSARQGDSGGPVFNRRGELAAVLWGTDGRTVGGTYCGRVRAFLAKLLRPCRPAEQPVSTPKESPDEANSQAANPGSNATANLDGTLSTRVNRLGERLEQLRRRLETIEKVAAVVDRLNDEKVREIAKHVVAQALTDGTSASTGDWLPTLMTALGWTGPPALAAMFALKLAGAALRRRRKRSTAADLRSPAVGTTSQTSLNDDYATQLAEVHALSGRSPMADVTLGREYDEELIRAEKSSNGEMAAWARRIRDTVANKFFRVHGESPSPVEPIDK